MNDIGGVADAPVARLKEEVDLGGLAIVRAEGSFRAPVAPVFLTR